MKTESDGIIFRAATQVLTVLLVLVYAGATLVMGQKPDRDPGVGQKIRNLEYSKFDALFQKDHGSLDTLFDNALMRVDPDGLLRNKADYLANSHKASVLQLKIVPGTMTVEVFGDVAVVVGIYEERGLIGARPYLQRCRFIDTWAFKNGTWICIASTTTSTIS